MTSNDAWTLARPPPFGRAPRRIADIVGKPWVTVSPVGYNPAAGILEENAGADFGPDTPGTTTSGWAEALASLPVGGGSVFVLPGKYTWSGTLNLPDTTKASFVALSPAQYYPSSTANPIGVTVVGNNAAGVISHSNAGGGGFLSFRGYFAFVGAATSPTALYVVDIGDGSSGWDFIDVEAMSATDNSNLIGCIRINTDGSDNLVKVGWLEAQGSCNSTSLINLGVNHLLAPTLDASGVGFVSSPTSKSGNCGINIKAGMRCTIDSMHFFNNLNASLYVSWVTSTTTPPLFIGQIGFELTDPGTNPMTLNGGANRMFFECPTIIGAVNIGNTWNPFTGNTSSGAGGSPGVGAASPAAWPTILKAQAGAGSGTSYYTLPKFFFVTTPAVPASGTAQANTNPFPVRVYITGAGTTTAYTITDPAGNAETFSLALAAGQEITLDPGASITITYSAAPTWKWYGV